VARIASATSEAAIFIHLPSELRVKKSPVCAAVINTSDNSEILFTPPDPPTSPIKRFPKYKLPRLSSSAS